MESETENKEVVLSPEQKKEVVDKRRRDLIIGIIQTTDWDTSPEKKKELGEEPFYCPRAIKCYSNWSELAKAGAKTLADKRAKEMGYEDCYTNCNLQYIHTPFWLCKEIIKKIEEFTSLKEKNILVLNIEMIEVLVNDFYIENSRITFVTDCIIKGNFVRKLFPNVEVLDKERFSKFLNGSSVMAKRQWDFVVMNPPYQDPASANDSLWRKFVEKSFDLCKENGYITSINPSAWRKPGHKLLEKFQERYLKYLEMHNGSDGQKTFGCGTRYDWYIIKNVKENGGLTTIIDESGKIIELDIKCVSFIPHKISDVLFRMIAKDEDKKLKIIHSRSMYGHDKSWMSKVKDGVYKFPCVCSTPCGKDPVCLFSSKKDGHFEVKKVIIGKASPENCFYDSGKFGVSDNCIAIEVDSGKEADSIIKAVSSKEFQEIMNSCKWSGFSIEPEVFESLKKDFWKEIV